MKLYQRKPSGIIFSPKTDGGKSLLDLTLLVSRTHDFFFFLIVAVSGASMQLLDVNPLVSILYL